MMPAKRLSPHPAWPPGLATWLLPQLLPLLLLAGAPLAAQTPLHQYPDADIASGEKLLREHQCAACHARKVGGDGSAIARTLRPVTAIRISIAGSIVPAALSSVRLIPQGSAVQRGLYNIAYPG